jgi:hypothetical protein
MSVLKGCICIVVLILGTINPLDLSVKYRIVHFFFEFYYYSQTGLLILDFDITRGA